MGFESHLGRLLHRMIYVIPTALMLPRLTLFATEHLEKSFKEPGSLIGSFFTSKLQPRIHLPPTCLAEFPLINLSLVTSFFSIDDYFFSKK